MLGEGQVQWADHTRPCTCCFLLFKSHRSVEWVSPSLEALSGLSSWVPWVFCPPGCMRLQSNELLSAWPSILPVLNFFFCFVFLASVISLILISQCKPGSSSNMLLTGHGGPVYSLIHSRSLTSFLCAGCSARLKDATIHWADHRRHKDLSLGEEN